MTGNLTLAPVGLGPRCEGLGRREAREHRGGAPDYLFSGDRRVRLKLDGMRPMRAAARAYAAHIVPREKRVAQMQYLRTGPSQYPKLNEMALQCAHRLGIGAPTLYIMPAPQRLDSDSFAQCHQGYVVNLNRVRAFRDRTLKLDGGAEVPVSRSYADHVKDILIKRLFDREESI